MLDLIADLNRETGVSFLLSSHQLPYLERVCSHVAVLHEGRIAASGVLRELLADSGSRIVLHSTQAGLATQLLENDSRVTDLERLSSTHLKMCLREWNSEQLVSFLVEHEVPVCELIRQRASLDNFFRELTAGGDS